MYLKFAVTLFAGLFSFGAPALAQAPAAASPLVVPAAVPENILNLDLSTGGRVVIQLRPDLAPQHVARIKTLARQGFYNGVLFHRVIEGFMAQTGDPTGTGTGGSPLPDLPAEFNGLPHVRGAVSAARSDAPNSANSQFFIVFSPRLTLDGKYSVFGRVVSGMQYVDAIERGEPPAAPSRIVKASLGSDNLPPPTPQEVAAAMARQPDPVVQAQAPVPPPAQTTPAQTIPAATPAAPAPAPIETPQTPAPQL
jgi:peptidylprolyl isomerase